MRERESYIGAGIEVRCGGEGDREGCRGTTPEREEGEEEEEEGRRGESWALRWMTGKLYKPFGQTYRSPYFSSTTRSSTKPPL